ncbi:MAG TPA: hypothetical protein VIV40_16210, partial [Kofleriaceae bacterium]
MGRTTELARFDARDPLIRSATNSTPSDHTSQMIAHVHTAHVSVVPNVLSAMLCASDMPADLPSTTCDGRSSTRISSSALTHACTAMKCATSRRQRSGMINAPSAMPAPIAGVAH